MVFNQDRLKDHCTGVQLFARRYQLFYLRARCGTSTVKGWSLVWSLCDFKELSTMANTCQPMVKCKILQEMRSLLALSLTSRHFSPFSPVDFFIYRFESLPQWLINLGGANPGAVSKVPKRGCGCTHLCNSVLTSVFFWGRTWRSHWGREVACVHWTLNLKFKWLSHGNINQRTTESETIPFLLMVIFNW